MSKTPFQASAPCIKLSAQYAVPLPFHANDIVHQTQELHVPSQKLQRAKRKHKKNKNITRISLWVHYTLYIHILYTLALLFRIVPSSTGEFDPISASQYQVVN